MNRILILNFNSYQNLSCRYMTTTNDESNTISYSNFNWWNNNALGFNWNITLNFISQVMPFNPHNQIVDQVASNDLACNTDNNRHSNWILSDHLIGTLVNTRNLNSNWDLSGELSNTDLMSILNLKFWLLRINILSSNPVELIVMQYISSGTRILGNFINNDSELQFIANGKSIQITDIMVTSPEINKNYPNMMVKGENNQFSFHVNGVDNNPRGTRLYGILRTNLLCLTDSQISQVCNFLLSN